MAEATRRNRILALLESVGLAPSDEPVMRESTVKESYERPPAFSNLLPWVQWDKEHKVWALGDTVSCGVVLEAESVDAEARPLEQLEEMLDKMVSAFSSIPERDDNPWVVQLYMQDEPLLDIGRRLREYADKFSNSKTDLAEDFFQKMEEHFLQIGREDGVFEDSKAGVRWSGKLRRIRLCVYRDFGPRSDWPDEAGRYPPDELNHVVDGLQKGLLTAGIKTNRLGPSQMYHWMVAWLNPKPRGYESVYDLLADHPMDDDDFIEGYNFSQGVLKSAPRGDYLKTGNWYFDEMPHRYIPVMAFQSEPAPGLLTLEKTGTKTQAAALFDKLPQGTIFTSTIVFSPQSRTSSTLEFVWNRSKSDIAESVQTKTDVEDCQAAMARGNKMYPASMGFYVRGEDERELTDRINSLFSACQSEHLDVLLPSHGAYPLNEYVHFMPMGYKPKYDSFLFREKLQWLMNVMAVSPLWGKSSGTGHPGFVFYDRSGAPVMFDILNEQDREKAAHMAILGPTGAGKSATLINLTLQTIAMRKPHMYIIDVGDSFRLLGEHCKRQGLKVHYVNLDDTEVPLPPFYNSNRMICEQILNPGDEGYVKVPKKDRRDFLGEMEVAARLIITGGDAIEERDYRREDKSIVRAALVDASISARTEGKVHADISDFVEQLDAYLDGKIPHGFSSKVSEKYEQRLSAIRGSARYFLDGPRDALFNQPGTLWPEVDVTIVDLGKIATQEDYKDMLALSFIGLMNTIQSDAEKRRGSGRQSITLIDEGHVTTTNPMLADYLTKGSKMWRKWGLWLWLATQNLADYPDESEKMLNMMEFWLCLRMPKKEIDEISRFKALTDEDKSLLLQARKEARKYAEGVMLSENDPALLRIVPPALALALAQTEEEEVAVRHSILEELGLDNELDAVYEIERRIIEARVH